MFRVLVPHPVHEAGLVHLRDRNCQVVTCPATEEAVRELLPSCDGCVSKTFYLRTEWLRESKRLRVVGKHGVGWDNVVDARAAEELGIWVVNTPEANAAAVAEHTIALMLALARHIPQMDASVRNGDWEYPERAVSMDLAGKTLGLIGMGRIGRMVARKAGRGLDMRVLGYDPYAPESAFGDCVVRRESLMELLAEADVVSLHLPGGENTRNSLGKKELAAMKPGAYLINCARGSVVDQEALVEALQAGKLAGAGLDVFDPEPLPADHVLTRMENVVLTTHSAALSQDALLRMSLDACQGVADVLEGKAPKWAVNHPKGGR